MKFNLLTIGIVIICLIFLFWSILNNNSETEFIKEPYQQEVDDFKNALKSGNKTTVAKLVKYPLDRFYPVPEIKNENDFINRYGHLFDNNLTSLILNSSTKNDWQPVGLRGVILNQGEIWLDYEGKITAINYSTEKEDNFKKEIIIKMKENLYSSLHDFKYPQVYLETKDLKIRIDLMNDEKYRYASWTIEKDTKEKPDLILQNGELILEGSGGNHHYVFVNDKYKYKININVLRDDETSPANLIVYEDEEIILKQGAIKLEN